LFSQRQHRSGRGSVGLDEFMPDQAMRVIYKITYPNGKIYVGMDMNDSIRYFGSVHADTLARDFTREQRKKFTITREILRESSTGTRGDVMRKENEFIRELRSNDPAVGYNRSPSSNRRQRNSTDSASRMS
jgi:hypothetical protein